MEAYICGRLDFDRWLDLQTFLVRQVADRCDGQICVVLCEHPEIITIGRGGSPGAIQLDSGRVRRGQVPVRWVKRGGPCLVHAPGQLAVYPVVPLEWYGLSVGRYLDLLQTAIRRSLHALDIATEPRPGYHGLWGRTGQLVAFGVAVNNWWVTSHGAFINVNPPMGLFRLIDDDPGAGNRISCLVAERRQPVRMPRVRAEVVRHLSEAFGCDRYHLYTGHPMFKGGKWTVASGE